MRSTPWPSSGVSRRRRRTQVWEKGRDAVFDVARIDAIEREAKHDVIAFLTHLAEIVGPEARFLHQGMTSSDVLDTCLAVQLDARRRPAPRRSRRAAGGAEAPRLRAQGHADDRPQPRHPCRADHLRPEARLRLCRVRTAHARGCSGARGDRHLRDLRRRRHLRQCRPAGRGARRRSAGPEPSSRSPPRSSRATATRCIFATLAVIASSVERLATEIRHLQRTEVLRGRGDFSPGPEGLLGDAAQAQPGAVGEPRPGWRAWCAATVMPALENVALWHERDISHSSVERVIGPDATVTLDFALARLAGLIEQAGRLPRERCGRISTASAASIHSQRVLLALTQAGHEPRGRLRRSCSATR